MNQPVHVPAAGPFQKPPTNQGKILAGSTGVFINGKSAARQGDMAMTCNDPADMPIGQVTAIGTVFIGETGAGAPSFPPTQKTQTFLNARWGQQGAITKAEWEKDRVKIGEKVKMIAKTKDFKDGSEAFFTVWEEKESGSVRLAEVEGAVRTGKVENFWSSSDEENEGEDSLQEQREFYFVIDIEGEEASSGPLIVTAEVKQADLIEIEDLHFNHNSAVVLPKALDKLAYCYLYLKMNSSKMMLIVGHTDRSGTHNYNQKLSEKRAENVLHILEGNRTNWIKTADRPSGGKSKIEDYQAILKWVSTVLGWDCDPGDIDNVLGTETKEAIKTFQETYNDKFNRSINVNGVVDYDTWGAFFDLYLIKLADALGEEESELKSYRNSLRFVSGIKTIGCGDRHATSKRAISLEDRRVEIFFFELADKPKLSFNPLCHEGPPDDPESYQTAGKKAKLCELYGTPGLYQINRLNVNLENLIRIKLYDYDGSKFTVKGEANYKVFDKEQNILLEGKLKDTDEILILSCLGLPNKAILEWNKAKFVFKVTPDSAATRTSPAK
jgi:outer membrane protein OmpA-like peptidoglycan-associated protein